jgi:hypothetical protein
MQCGLFVYNCDRNGVCLLLLRCNIFLISQYYTVQISGGTNQTIIWLIDKFSLFEINRYLINLNQTIQIIQKGDFWGKNRRFLAF